MYTNLYHIASFRPATEKYEMTVGREKLANDLVNSGRLRIDAGFKINFARLYIPNLRISAMFSYRELYDTKLIQRTRNYIAKELQSHYAGQSLEKKIDEYVDILKKEVDKYQKISHEDELRLSRLIVQAAHPVVMMLIIAEGVEVFISHSHNIGDVLDIVSWQTAGSNSGMQSTNGRDVAIFISCGGDPLAENENKSADYGDGWPARARILVIGGQEIGHFSDIMRDKNGHQISRYSADFRATRPKEDVRLARINDIKRTFHILKTLQELGLEKAIETEKKIKFYRDNKKIGIMLAVNAAYLIWQDLRLTKKAKSKNITFLTEFNNEPRKYTLAKAMIEDMLFNLEPKADAYQRSDKEEEEAIACVEALARVPQQANKWGKVIAKAFMQDLYNVYYGKVIPGCIQAYKNITKLDYSYNSRHENGGLMQIIKSMIYKRLYYPSNKSSLLK